MRDVDLAVPAQRPIILTLYPYDPIRCETWILQYQPNGVKFADMIGQAKTIDKDRAELFGDIGSDPRDSNASRKAVLIKPSNSMFAQAMERASRNNPEVQ